LNGGVALRCLGPVTMWLATTTGMPSYAAEPPPHEAATPAKEGKREFNFFPIVGGDSDVGFGGGQFSNWARLGRGERDFLWKVEDAALITFKVRDSHFVIPFFDIWALWTVPHFGPGGRLRIEVRPSYTDERTLGYYGIGDAAPYPEAVPTSATEYRRTHPTLAGRLRGAIFDGLFLTVGSSFTASWLDIPAGSLLLRDADGPDPEVRRLLSRRKSNAVELLELALEYDTRDNETVTEHGQYHMLLGRFSPSLSSWMPYEYLQVEAIARFYFMPVPRWLAVSVRVVGDVLLGEPPFYELARFDDTPAIGGGMAIRGVPAQRYHGKVKLFGNVEMRSDVWSFSIRNKPMMLGLAAFVDAGRLWTELLHAHPELDGSGLGLKYGVGTGLRFQEGRTFVVRADLAWSPDARPIGGYFSAGEIF
jgi:hypothetical protein